MTYVLTSPDAVLYWTKKNYARLHSYNERLAKAGFADGMRYDPATHQIIKEYEPGISPTPDLEVLDVDPPAAEVPGDP